VFLGTPHPTFEKRTNWPQLSRSLAFTKLSTSSISQADSDLPKIAHLSTRLHEAGIQVPVLSVYEMKQTKVKSKVPFGSNREFVSGASRTMASKFCNSEAGC